MNKDTRRGLIGSQEDKNTLPLLLSTLDFVVVKFAEFEAPVPHVSKLCTWDYGSNQPSLQFCNFVFACSRILWCFCRHLSDTPWMKISFLRWCCNSEKQRNHPIGRTTETVIVRSVGAAMQPSARDLKIPATGSSRVNQVTICWAVGSQ